MTRNDAKDLILALVSELDYDMYKWFTPDFPDDPELINARIDDLIHIVSWHIQVEGEPWAEEQH